MSPESTNTLTIVRLAKAANIGVETIRAIAKDRVAQIEARLADLERMRKVLRHLVHECDHTKSDIPCPIIESLASGPTAFQ